MTQRNVKLDENVAWTCTNFISCDINAQWMNITYTLNIYSLFYLFSGMII